MTLLSLKVSDVGTPILKTHVTRGVDSTKSGLREVSVNLGMKEGGSIRFIQRLEESWLAVIHARDVAGYECSTLTAKLLIRSTILISQSVVHNF